MTPESIWRSDWCTLAAVLAAQLVLGAAVRIAPIRSLARWRRLSASVRPVVVAPDDRVAWAIEAIGRRLPGISTCLVRALVADLFLSTPERAGRVRIGIRRAENGTLQSHAWFERDGRIVVGGHGLTGYVELMTLDTTCLERV